MNAKMTKQKIIEFLGNINNCTSPTTVCAVVIKKNEWKNKLQEIKKK